MCIKNISFWWLLLFILAMWYIKITFDALVQKWGWRDTTGMRNIWEWGLPHLHLKHYPPRRFTAQFPVSRASTHTYIVAPVGRRPPTRVGTACAAVSSTNPGTRRVTLCHNRANSYIRDHRVVQIDNNNIIYIESVDSRVSTLFATIRVVIQIRSHTPTLWHLHLHPCQPLLVHLMAPWNPSIRIECPRCITLRQVYICMPKSTRMRIKLMEVWSSCAW